MAKKDLEILKKEFGVKALGIRLDKGLSLRQVAARCSLDNSKISKIEKGKVNVSLSTIADLALGLDVPLTELMPGAQA